ncbi:MAG: type II toxin-antitoxin system death-on-curing family toxin [Chlamydiia bacterium]|nr:type II toxin-antitoxin system death-on-curing family toxin [Chlamydiia bacterium]
MNFLSLEDVLEFHDEIVKEYGGVFGVRDIGLLISALEMPKAAFGGKLLHSDPFQMGAAYLYHIISNHPFLDGNKRTGLVAALVFFELNEIHLKYDERVLEDLVVDVAAGKASKSDVADFFKKSSR